jgi:hypothetical protein
MPPMMSQHPMDADNHTMECGCNLEVEENRDPQDCEGQRWIDRLGRDHVRSREPVGSEGREHPSRCLELS